MVLKGLLNTEDEAARGRRPSPNGSSWRRSSIPTSSGSTTSSAQGTEGYIVMEYVGGKTREGHPQGARPAAAGRGHRLHPSHPPAFGYLHGRGLVYCDFKPDNFMLEGEPT